jgi:hypothetical protein
MVVQFIVQALVRVANQVVYEKLTTKLVNSPTFQSLARGHVPDHVAETAHVAKSFGRNFAREIRKDLDRIGITRPDEPPSTKK